MKAKLIRRLSITAGTVAVAVGAYYLWLYVVGAAPTQSVVFYGLMKATAGVCYLRIIDDLIYPIIDTEKLLRENAIAYAIYIAAYAYVIGNAFGV
jgi:hypothetical protein